MESMVIQHPMSFKPKYTSKILEFVHGQAGHPSPAAPISGPVPFTPVDPAAKAASAIPIPRHKILRAAKLRTMAKIAGKVKRRLSKMGLLKKGSSYEMPKK